MKKLIFLLMTSTSLLSQAANKFDINDEDNFKTLTVIMKISECNTMSSLYKFQQENNVPNGDKFIDEFMKSEAKKKNSNLVDMANACQKALIDFTEITSSKN